MATVEDRRESHNLCCDSCGAVNRVPGAVDVSLSIEDVVCAVERELEPDRPVVPLRRTDLLKRRFWVLQVDGVEPAA